MTRLVVAELRRIAARRALHLLVLAGLLLMAALGTITARSMRPPTPAELVANQEAYRVAVAQWKVNGPATIAECEQDSRVEVARGGVPIDCTDLGPRPEFYAASPHRVTEITSALPIALALGTGLVCVLAAATVVGAEFETRTMATWLLAEPRRGRVYASKLVALGVTGLALTLVATTVGTVMAGLVGGAVRADMTMTPQEVASYLARCGRVVVLVPVATMAVGALAFLVRNTATTVVTVLGAAIASTVLATTRWGHWALLNNVEAWVTGASDYFWSACGGPDGCQDLSGTVGLPGAAGFLFGLCAVLIGAGLVVFRRRDVA